MELAFLGGYSRSDQTHEYEYDPGVVVLPVASRTAAHRIIRLHGGVGKRTVRWDLARNGVPPTVPAMANTLGDTFIGGTIAPTLPQPSRTGSGYDWSVSGEYVFVQNTPRVAGTDPLPVGSHPFIVVGPATEGAPIAAQYAQYYTGDNPFPAFVEALGGAITVAPDGSFKWPFLALPTAFTSTDILRD